MNGWHITRVAALAILGVTGCIVGLYFGGLLVAHIMESSRFLGWFGVFCLFGGGGLILAVFLDYMAERASDK